ncbi:MAG TPA: hypothetical protein DCY13_15305 [Verrucomicrobiales bacterium]|nr:hypothetical protein [Verrucomicrobiales bacterium]
MNLIILLQIAGLLHLGLLVVGLMMPRVVDFDRHVASLPPFLRQLFRVYYAFIGGIIIAFGAISFFLAGQLVAGGPVATAMLLVMLIFWLARFAVALFVFDLSPFLTTRWRRIGHHTINLAFLYLPVVYGYALWKGIAP